MRDNAGFGLGSTEPRRSFLVSLQTPFTAVTEPTPTVNAAARAAAPGDNGAQRRVTLVANTNEDRALVPYQSEPGESR